MTAAMLRLQSVPLVALAVLTLVAGCDSGEVASQRAFEDVALLSPVEGITQTRADGTVVRRDSADWQVGPAYQTRVTFLSVPFPNPVSRSTETLFLTLDVAGGVAGGLEVQVLYEDPRSGALDFLDLEGGRCTSATASAICSFSLLPSQIDSRNTGGLYRLVVLDGRGIVSYGDVQIDP